MSLSEQAERAITLRDCVMTIDGLTIVINRLGENITILFDGQSFKIEYSRAINVTEILKEGIGVVNLSPGQQFIPTIIAEWKIHE